MSYKYKFAQGLSLVVAVVISWVSVNTTMAETMWTSGKIALHGIEFCAAIVFVILAIYFRYKDAHQK